MGKNEAANLTFFSVLEQEYLETLAFGAYQLKHAPGYIKEHLPIDGTPTFRSEAFNINVDIRVPLIFNIIEQY